MFTAIEKAAAQESGESAEWVHAVSAACESDPIRSLVAALAVERIPVSGEPAVRDAVAYSAKLQLLTVMRQIAELKSSCSAPTRSSTRPRTGGCSPSCSRSEPRRQELQARTLGTID